MAKQNRRLQRGPKKKLKRVGHFRELAHGEPGGPSLVEGMRDHAAANEAQVLEYLREGVPYIASPGPVWSVVDGQGPIGTGSVLTDGEWAWPDDLAHYVERYHVALPDDFIAHAMINNWRVPEIPDEELVTFTLV